MNAKRNDAATVDDFMAKLEHPLKAEIALVREILATANPLIAERIKWNAPSFFYRYDMAAFHLRPQNYVHVVFVFHNGTMIESPGLLEGSYKDRRMAKFYSMDDIAAKTPALQQVVNDWVRLVG